MTRRRRRPHSRRAFATLTALGIIVVVAVAIAALTAVVAHDVKRSIRQADDAQVRQLLLAGELAARASLADGLPGRSNVPLPGELASAGYSLRFEGVAAAGGGANGTLDIRVTVHRPDGRTASQLIRYARAGDGWRLRAAELP